MNIDAGFFKMKRNYDKVIVPVFDIVPVINTCCNINMYEGELILFG
jgi:hypothetical protein